MDEFAQDLRTLYGKAYAGITKGTLEVERVGQTVLASQFVACLRPHLQSRVVGMEGAMDQLVLKARFEEAKSKELAAARSGPATKSNKGDANGGTCFGASRKGDRGSSRQDKSTQQEDVTDKCFNCGMEGHYVGIVLTPNRKRKMCRRGGRRSPP